MEDIESWELKFELCQYSDKLLNLLTILNKRDNKIIDLNEVKKSIYYAKKYHGNQLRKSGEAYYTHPLEVAYLFAEYVGKEKREYYTTNLIVIAILHDCLEDTALTYQMIKTIFSKNVADGVQDLTRVKDGIKYEAYKTLDSLYLQRKIDLLYIKLFDRFHNIVTLNQMVCMKQVKIAEETYDHFIIYAECLELEKLSKELINISYKYLPIKTDPSQLLEQSHFSFELDDYHVLALTSQNDEDQKHNQ